MRLLDNDELSPEEVNDVKDFLDDYVERNQVCLVEIILIWKVERPVNADLPVGPLYIVFFWRVLEGVFGGNIERDEMKWEMLCNLASLSLFIFIKFL